MTRSALLVLIALIGSTVSTLSAQVCYDPSETDPTCAFGYYLIGTPENDQALEDCKAGGKTFTECMKELGDFGPLFEAREAAVQDDGSTASIHWLPICEAANPSGPDPLSNVTADFGVEAGAPCGVGSE